MATIRKRGNRWQVQVRRQGAVPVSRSFLLKSDAEVWARQMEVEADRGGLPVDPRTARKMLLSELLIRYRDTVVPQKRSQLAETKMINALLRQPFAKLPVADVTPAVLCAYRDKRLTNIKPASLCREFSILNSMFQTAIREWGVNRAGFPGGPIS